MEILGRAVVGLISSSENNVGNIGGIVQFTSESSVYIRGLRYDGNVSGQ